VCKEKRTASARWVGGALEPGNAVRLQVTQKRERLSYIGSTNVLSKRQKNAFTTANTSKRWLGERARVWEQCYMTVLRITTNSLFCREPHRASSLTGPSLRAPRSVSADKATSRVPTHSCACHGSAGCLLAVRMFSGSGSTVTGTGVHRGASGSACVAGPCRCTRGSLMTAPHCPEPLTRHRAVGGQDASTSERSAVVICTVAWRPSVQWQGPGALTTPRGWDTCYWPRGSTVSVSLFAFLPGRARRPCPGPTLPSVYFNLILNIPSISGTKLDP
jgi:hypothetical protein